VLKRAAAIGIALSVLSVLLVLIIVTLLAGGIRLLPLYRIGPEDILPAGATVLWIHKPTTEDLQRWQAAFPALDDIASIPSLDDVAVIRLEQGGMEGIALQRRSGETSGKGCTMGPYEIVASAIHSCPTGSTADHFLAEGPRLAADPGYRALGKPPHGSWIFMRRESWKDAPTLAGRILESVTLSSATHMRISSGSGMTMFALWPMQPLSHSYARQVIPVIPETHAVLAMGDAREALERGLHVLNPSDRLTTRGLLLAEAAKLFGTEVSVEHQLIPLFAEHVTLTVIASASGTNMVIAGEVRNAARHAEAIKDLHHAFRIRHPNVAIVERVFDGRFSARTMRVSEERITEERYTEDGWDIRITEDREDHQRLVTAARGRAVHISDDLDALMSSIDEEALGMALPTSRRPLALQTSHAALLPRAWLDNSPLLHTAVEGLLGGHVILSLEQQGATGFLRLQGQER
jgi:hypothetical protein